MNDKLSNSVAEQLSSYETSEMPRAEERLPGFRADYEQVPRTQRLDYARARIGGLFDLQWPAFEEGQQPSFSEAVWHYDKFILGDLVYSPRSIVRSVRHSRLDQLDHYSVTLRVQGRAQCDHDGTRRIHLPGEIILSDMSRPSRQDLDGGRGITLFIPRETLDEALPKPMNLHGVVPRGAAALMLATHMHSLVQHSDLLRAGAASTLARATIDLLAAALFSSYTETAPSNSPAQACLVLRQMCRYIELHLNEPDLSAERIAGAFKMSRSNLYRLFEPMGGVSNFVKERRLAKIHSLLLDESPKRIYIGRLAEDHGFVNAAHFSRAFREQYGYSPQDLRNRRQIDLGPAARIAVAPSGLSVRDWLRTMLE